MKFCIFGVLMKASETAWAEDLTDCSFISAWSTFVKLVRSFIEIAYSPSFCSKDFFGVWAGVIDVCLWKVMFDSNLRSSGFLTWSFFLKNGVYSEIASSDSLLSWAGASELTYEVPLFCLLRSSSYFLSFSSIYCSSLAIFCLIISNCSSASEFSGCSLFPRMLNGLLSSSYYS